MKTPFWYSIVPIAPSKTCGRESVRRSWNRDIWTFCRSRAEVLRLRMVHHQRRGGQLGHQRARLGQVHAELLARREQAEHQLVLPVVRACGVPPGVAQPAVGGDAQL